jgi:DtxR family Mn-dependent transcriptional regulator
MLLTDRAEEILETLWIELVENEKEECDVSILRDDGSLKELINIGYGKIEGNHISLTNKGKEEAKGCIRRHRLAERLLVDVLSFKGELVHETSCRFEHILHKGLDENICTLLGHPKTCPHGKPIPEGGCCRDLKREPRKLIMPLTDLGVKKRARISYLQTQERNALQKMIAIGALPKTEITLIQKFPSYVFQIGKSQFTIDKELASCIYVRMV